MTVSVPRSFYRRWIIANGLAELVGLGGTFAIGRAVAVWLGDGVDVSAHLATISVAVLVGAAFEGAVVGYGQAAAVVAAKRDFPKAAWVRATVLGAALAWLVGMLVGALASSGGQGTASGAEPSRGIMLAGAAAIGLLVGPLLAVAQWHVLRRIGVGARRWIGANALAWAAGMPVIFFGMSTLPPAASWARCAATVAVASLAAGLLVGAIHGRTLKRILTVEGVVGPLGSGGDRPCRVAVFGASGRTGRAIVDAALARGWTVRAFVRQPSSLPVQPGLELIVGSLDDRELVERAVRGIDAVAIVLGPRPPSREVFCAQATRVVIRAMEHAGVDRLLCQTGAMVGELPPSLSWGIRLMAWWFRCQRPAVAADRAEQERLVSTSGLKWTILKPPRLTRRVRTTGYLAGGCLPLTLLDSIGRADLAGFCLDEIALPRFATQKVYLTRGPALRPSVAPRPARSTTAV